MAVIDLQQIAASIYDTVLNLNKSATEMIGLDCMWCRLLPYDNGEDVIVQEYTLHQYECPQSIKVVSNNQQFNVGNFSIDLFGIKNSEQLEISIDIDTWKSVYGEGTMPQKGDFVLVSMMHRPYEVISSTAVHTIGELLTSWKCILGEWKHSASRKETEEFSVSIDELTNGQDRLFGDIISKEVADAVVETETGYRTSTHEDKLKQFDIDSIEIEDVVGKSGNTICNAYYNFTNSVRNVEYDIQATYDPTCDENKWIYSTWFRFKGDISEQRVTPFRINKLINKDKDYWTFDISAQTQLYAGQLVHMYRGTIISLNGVIEPKPCDAGWQVVVPAPECLKANKKVLNFWTNGIWKMKINRFYNLFTALEEDKVKWRIDVDVQGQIRITVGENNTFIDLEKPLENTGWYYVTCELSPTGIRTILLNNVKAANGRYSNKVLVDKQNSINIKSFSFDKAVIDNTSLNICMCNIRLYESEYNIGTTYKVDMYNEITKNASKLILVDTPNVANKMTFKTSIR